MYKQHRRDTPDGAHCVGGEAREVCHYRHPSRFGFPNCGSFKVDDSRTAPMIRKCLLAVTLAALLSPGMAAALGLGNIEVTSALNEPFRARIPLRGARPGELDELRARLGDSEQFARAGLDRAFVLTKIQFRTVEQSATSGFIELSTRDAVAEPFLNFLVDVSWSRGRVLREYTVLLDPPVYGAAIRSATAKTAQRPQPAPAASVAAPAATPSPAPAAAAAASGTSRAAYSGDSYGPVRRGETLWSIAQRVRPGGVSIQSMMLALLNANPEAFTISNINALKSGAVLRIPAAGEIQPTRAEALAEVTRQHALWEEYRQSLARKVPATPSGSDATASGAAATEAQPASGSSETTAAASGELKLLGGDSAGSGGGGDVKALRDELTVAQEEADAARRENDDLKSRLNQAESLVDDLKRLVEIKEEQLAALQNQLASDDSGVTATPDASGEGATTGAPSTDVTQTPVPMPATDDAPATDSTTAPMPASSDAPATDSTSAATTDAPASDTASSASTDTMASDTTVPSTPSTGVSTATDAQPTGSGEQAPAATEVPQQRKRVRQPPPPPQPTSLLEEINSLLPVPLWSILAGLGALLVAIGGVRFARSRKLAREDAAMAAATAGGAGALAADALEPFDGEGTLVDEGMEDETTRTIEQALDEPAPAEAAMDDDFGTAPGGDTEVEELEDDPLAEVNVYLAYERFEQAEELVRDAISSFPEREDYRLKLVEVFYASKDVAKFEQAAHDLSDAVGSDHPMMDQAREWWDELNTGRALFGAAALAAGVAATQIGGDEDDALTVTSTEVDSAETGVDFDLTFETLDADGEPSGVDFDLGAESADEEDGSASKVDFDLGDLATGAAGAAAATVTAAASAGSDMPAGAGSGLDFDLGDIDGEETSTGPIDPIGESSLVEDAVGGETGLDFDLSGMSLEDTVAAPSMTANAPLGEETGLDFDLGDDVAGAASSALDFDLGSVSATGSESDGAVDFDVSGEDAGHSSVIDFDLGSEQPALEGASSALDFDLGDEAPAGEGASSALDFDLGDTDSLGETVTTSRVDEPSSTTDDALDFDLGETMPSGAGNADVDTQPFLQDGTGLGPQAAGDSDLDLGGIGADSLGVGSEDSLDLDLGSLDDAGTGTGLELPELSFDTLEMDTTPEGAVDTVQLKAQQAADVASEAAGEGTGAGVDTEFRDIFGASGASDNGARSELDLDLGEGSDDFISPDSSAEDDDAPPDTEFLLPETFGELSDDDEGGLLAGGGDEMQTKLDLAQAYIDMGDTDGARNLLDEVVAGGDDEQKSAASNMLSGLSA